MDLFNRKKKIEEKMAEWLAHPAEYGVRPTSVRLKRSYKVDLITSRGTDIHLVEYVMPDGTTGRGFVNGSLTWSFLGDRINAISDDDLLLAYCGWAWLFPAVHAGTVQTDFNSEGEEALYLLEKKQEGFEEVSITCRYKIDDSEIFEFTGIYKGKRVKGAGDSTGDILFTDDDPRFYLSPIYFFLGDQLIESVK